MLFGLFGKKQNRCLGIDFGSSGIKIAELGRDDKNRLVLHNYVIGQTKINSKFSISKLDEEATAKILKDLLDKAKISTRRAVVSLSVGETFSTIIDLPFMTEADLAKAIPFQAQKYVPVPLEEVILDWSVVGEFQTPSSPQTRGGTEGGVLIDSSQHLTPALSSSEERGKNTKSDTKAGLVGSPKKIQVLIVAVPKDLIKKIAQVAKKINLKILAIEQEAFSIVRALIGKDQEPFLIVDFGQESIDFILVDKNSIRFTYTFLTEKKPDLIAEAQKIIGVCESRYRKKIAKIILTGGGASQANLAAEFNQKLNIASGLGDPFARLTYEQKLSPILKEIALFMAVAVGGAMREL